MNNTADFEQEIPWYLDVERFLQRSRSGYIQVGDIHHTAAAAAGGTGAKSFGARESRLRIRTHPGQQECCCKTALFHIDQQIDNSSAFGGCWYD